MKGVLQPVMRRTPDELILHVGTNNVRGSDSPEDLFSGISSLVSIINEKSQNTKSNSLWLSKGF